MKPTFFPWLANGISTPLNEYDAGLLGGVVPCTGGFVFPMKATAQLLIGDLVILDTATAGNVKKSLTAGDAALVVGIVVGGTQTNMEVMQLGGVVGHVAASTDEVVLVARAAICYVIADVQLAVGDQICIGGNTTGRVGKVVDLTVATGATPVTSSGANGAILSGQGFRKAIGIMLQACSGAGKVGLALIF